MQGLSLDPALLLQALASPDISLGGYDDKGGPWITIGGTITLSGIKANIIFRNNVRGTHTAEATSTVSPSPRGWADRPAPAPEGSKLPWTTPPWRQPCAQ